MGRQDNPALHILTICRLYPAFLYLTHGELVVNPFILERYLLHCRFLFLSRWYDVYLVCLRDAMAKRKSLFSIVERRKCSLIIPPSGLLFYVSLQFSLIDIGAGMLASLDVFRTGVGIPALIV